MLYTFENRCLEAPSLALGDESVKVVVNTKGSDGAIGPELKELVRYLDDGTVSGSYSQTLEAAVQSVKSSAERRHEYMILMVREQEIRAQEREEGRKLEREKQTQLFYKRLLAANIPEDQARALAFGEETKSPPKEE